MQQKFSENSFVKSLTNFRINLNLFARCAGSVGSMSASGSAGLWFDPWRGSKFSFSNQAGRRPI